MRKVLLLVGAALVVGTAASAHHSYSATYDTSQRMTLDGKLVQFVFKNPHSFVTIMAPDSKGVARRWSLEWSGTGQLSGQGVTRETLKPGDVITGIGYQFLDGSQIIRLERVIFADGKEMLVYANP